jgi:uncharacterized protein (DUF1330 family)
MPAYVISDIQPLDPDAIRAYRDLAQATIAKYGGRYIVRGGAIDRIEGDRVEGDWNPTMLVIVEFASMDRARECYHSPEYAEARKLRQTALQRNLIFVEGVAPA